MESPDEKSLTKDFKKVETLYCHCCSHAHLLEKCEVFQRKKHREKIRLIKEKGICFGCLGVGHMSRDCNKRMICEVCDQQHPTALHIHKVGIDSAQKDKPPGVLASTSSQTCGRTGAGKDRCILSIIPVQVKSTKGNKIIQTYAFLDPGSTATFCLEHLMQQLNITGKKTSFLLKTMGQEKIVPAYSLAGMEVSELKGKSFYPLPEVLTQKEMPVTPDDIISASEVENWPYLSKVHISTIKANVDLLI